MKTEPIELYTPLFVVVMRTPLFRYAPLCCRCCCALRCVTPDLRYASVTIRRAPRQRVAEIAALRHEEAQALRARHAQMFMPRRHAPLLPGTIQARAAAYMRTLTMVSLIHSRAVTLAAYAIAAMDDIVPARYERYRRCLPIRQMISRCRC